MEVECLALKDLSSPRKSFKVEEEDRGQGEQKVSVESPTSEGTLVCDGSVASLICLHLMEGCENGGKRQRDIESTVVACLC